MFHISNCASSLTKFRANQEDLNRMQEQINILQRANGLLRSELNEARAVIRDLRKIPAFEVRCRLGKDISHTAAFIIPRLVNGCLRNVKTVVVNGIKISIWSILQQGYFASSIGQQNSASSNYF